VDETTAYWGIREIGKRLNLTSAYPYKRIRSLIRNQAFPAYKKQRVEHGPVSYYTEEWLVRQWQASKCELLRQSLTAQQEHQEECRAKGLRPPRLKVKA